MKKLSLINLHDYPRSAYSAYWEIGVATDYSWLARLMSYEGGLLEESGGQADSEESARRDSQTWVLDRIEQYRRA